MRKPIKMIDGILRIPDFKIEIPFVYDVYEKEPDYDMGEFVTTIDKYQNSFKIHGAKIHYPGLAVHRFYDNIYFKSEFEEANGQKHILNCYISNIGDEKGFLTFTVE